MRQVLFPYFRRRPVGPTATLIITLGVVATLSPFAVDLYLPSFPDISRDLGIPGGHVQQTLTSYLVGMAIGQFIIGTFSDRFGRWLPLVTMTAAAGVVGFFAAIAPNITVLILMRFLQGFTLSAGMVISRAIVRDIASGVQAARLFSLLMVLIGLAPVLAPIIGGALNDIIGWRALLMILVVMALLTILAVMLFVPETLPRARREKKMTTAFANIRPLLRNRVFVGYGFVVVFGYGVMFAFVSNSSFVLQGVFGLTPFEYGMVFAINAVGLLSGAFLSSRLVGRTSSVRLVAGALLVQLIVLGLLFCLTLSGDLNLAAMQVLIFISSFMFSSVAANGIALSLSNLSQGIGMGSALIGSTQFIVGGIITLLSGIDAGRSVVPMSASMLGTILIASIFFMLTWRWQRREAGGSEGEPESRHP